MLESPGYPPKSDHHKDLDQGKDSCRLTGVNDEGVNCQCMKTEVFYFLYGLSRGGQKYLSLDIKDKRGWGRTQQGDMGVYYYFKKVKIFIQFWYFIVTKIYRSAPKQAVR